MTVLVVIGIVVVALILLTFSIYWFELDTAFIKKVEPKFRKAQSKYRKKKGLEK